MTEQEIIEMIKEEIKWCENNPFDDETEDFRHGFTAGLSQVITLIELGNK